MTAISNTIDLLNLHGPSFTRLVTAPVTEASADIAVCTLPDGSVGRLPITAFYANRTWEIGQRYHLAATSTIPPQLSATADELVALLLQGLSPEVRDGRVRVMGVTRHVGVRAKIAVAATSPDVDPVGACLGRAANRIKTLSAMLMGERVDVVSYHPDPERFLLNALAVSPLSVVTAEDGTVVVTVPKHQLAAARGGGNLNVVLASRLCGEKVQVLGS